MTQSKKIFIKTFGCQMNDYDSERMYRLAELSGYQRVQAAEQADFIVINTCSVRAKPEHKAVSEIGWMHKRARAHEDVKVTLAGCVAQQIGGKLLDDLPYLDGALGTGAVGRFDRFLARVEAGERPWDNEIDDDSVIGMPDSCLDEREPSSVTAFVSIMRGCNNFCSYCIVPYVRGPEKSRPAEKIMEEVRSLVRSGVAEVTLLGQNVNSYGRSLADPIDFVGLLEKVQEISGLKRIRFTTSHPKDLSPELIEAFARLPKLASHIHLAVQSGSDEILRRMKRKYTASQYMEKVNALRRACQTISITSDMIVGFCGETEEDFQATLSMMRSVRFDNLFSFMYSPRPGTKAAELPDDIPEPVKKQRLEELQTLQKEITLEKNQAMVERVEEVLVEGDSKGEPGRKLGRTRCFRTVHFTAPEAKPGDLIRVRIDAGYQNALVGAVEKMQE